MKYKKLGKTGLEVSQISFGGIRLGNLSQEKVTELIDDAIDQGMNYIDTARVYGTSEPKVGQALADIGKREEVIISSKIINRDLTTFKSDFNTILDNLQTDYLDILFMHDISTKKEWKQVNQENIFEYVKKEKDKGRVKHLGISTHNLDLGEEMLKSGKFEVVMVAYNVSNTEAETGIIPLAKSQDMGIVIMKPYGGGIFTEAGSKELGFEIKAEESLRFAASHPDISTVIPGLDKMEYVDTAVKVGKSDISLTEEEKGKLIEKVNIKSEHYCRGCEYCLPCPQDIEIPKLLSLYNRHEAFQGINWSQLHMIEEEYEEVEIKADFCIDCGQCEESCPYSLPVSDLMDEIVEKIG
ncbi:MAG: aldo/keto reductase [Bacillota bacterium]